MTSKLHTQDNSVVERRLRPIYEWLDTGNNKKALQECEKVLKKTPNLSCAKGLKALSLLRLGKENECLSIMEGLTLQEPCDDATLQAMTLCHRELQQFDKICALYEIAVKKDPINEELHTHLFMSYVRIADFKSQQRVAMNLYKLKQKNPYYCWSVMSVILQATRGPGRKDSQKRTLLLSLAERMMEKLITDNKLEAEQEVQLYLMVLELQGRYEEALKVIDGNLGAKLVCAGPTTYLLPYLVKLEQWVRVNLLCKRILQQSMDKWDIWLQYIESVFHLMEKTQGETCYGENGEGDLEAEDDSPEKAHEFICRLVENGVDNGYLLRGPYLARFQLCWKLCEKGLDSNDLLGETIELFIEYFRKFGHKPCCVSDLRIYLRLLDAEKQSELSVRLLKDVGIGGTGVPQTEQQMQRHICSLQLSRLCGGHRNLSADYLGALVVALSLHYQHGQQTYGTSLLPTDQGLSDAYALLASHVLCDLSVVTGKSQLLVGALVLLENLLENSPSNFNAKLLCVKLYHALGAGLGANASFDSLDIKHLQVDSLGFMHCSRLSTTGLFSLASSTFDATLKFFSSNYKDSSDHLTFSYKFGSFVKLDEFMDFREKLFNSFHYTATAVDRILLNLVLCSGLESVYELDMSPRDNNIDWDHICINYDLNVYCCWEPERTKGLMEEDAEIKRLFRQDLLFLKLRLFIIQCLATCVDIVKSTDGTRTKHVHALLGIIQEWEEAWTACQDDEILRPISQHLPTMPLPSRLHSHITCIYYQSLSPLFVLIADINHNDTENGAKRVSESNETLEKLMELLKSRFRTQNDSQHCFLERRLTIETIVNIVEILSISSIISALCFDLIKTLVNNKKSKRKCDSPFKSLLINAVQGVKRQVLALDYLLDDWRIAEDTCDLTDRLAALNLNCDKQSNVLEHVKSSHIVALKEIRTVLKNKIKFLSIFG